VIQKLLKILAEMYKDDPSAPAVLISLLPGGRYYVSLQRFTEGFGKGRVIVAKSSGSTLEEPLEELGRLLDVPSDG
jgi:hypothetical protein